MILIFNVLFIICFLGLKASLKAQDKKAVYVLFDTKNKTYTTKKWNGEKVRKYQKYETDDGIDFDIEDDIGVGPFFDWDKKNKPDTLSISFLKKISLTSHDTVLKKIKSVKSVFSEEIFGRKLYILERLNDRYLIRYPVKKVYYADRDEIIKELRKNNRMY